MWKIIAKRMNILAACEALTKQFPHGRAERETCMSDGPRRCLRLEWGGDITSCLRFPLSRQVFFFFSLTDYSAHVSFTVLQVSYALVNDACTHVFVCASASGKTLASSGEGEKRRKRWEQRER